MIGLRRELIEKITQAMINTKLFPSSLAYPRRYFDDLLLDQKKEEQHVKSLYDQTVKGLTGSQKKFNELLAQKVPFGVIPGKQLESKTPLLQ